MCASPLFSEHTRGSPRTDVCIKVLALSYVWAHRTGPRIDVSVQQVLSCLKTRTSPRRDVCIEFLALTYVYAHQTRPRIGVCTSPLLPEHTRRSPRKDVCIEVLVLMYDRMALFLVTSNPSLVKFRMAVSAQRLIRYTSCLVLGYGFLDRQIEFQGNHVI